MPAIWGGCGQGWYNHAGDINAPQIWNQMAAAVRGGTTKSGGGTLGKPMVISETGAAGIYEWDDNTTDAKWTLKYLLRAISMSTYPHSF